MKALVTGGAGFLGKNIVRELVSKNYDVVSYDILSQLPISVSGYKHVVGDITDSVKLRDVMKGCDIIFHTAAIADIDVAAKIPVKTMDINVTGTARCLEAAVENNIKRFVFASSIYTMGKRGSFYRISKVAGESLCKTFFEEFGMKYTITRYGSLYGEDSNKWNFIYKICKDLLTKKRFVYTSSPEAIREFIHIRDASRETVRISSDKDFENATVLITGHSKIKMNTLFDMIKEIIGKDVEITYEPPEKRRHYIYTPYSFDPDIPIRIIPDKYYDIGEDILGCLKAVNEEIKHGN
jgi:UDP-glucose 4-epimerase